ncbi:MAG: MFS transporter, partial [Acidobacteria bacterium]|nr:MFS transporter [Acidobacteriota bacterium]
MSPQPVAFTAPAPSRPERALLPLALYCLGHFMVDLYSASLGVLQPLLLDQFKFNFTQAGILAGFLVFSSSVMQPVYGYLSDRFHSRLFSALGPALAAIFISSLGWAPHYGALLAMVLLGGAGIAAFHPHAASNAIAGVRENRARAMAIFICSGTVGLALGPSFFSVIAGNWGLAKTPVAAIPGIAVTLLLLAFLPPAVTRDHTRRKHDWSQMRAVWKPMLILYLLVFIRSIVQITFTQFLPLYLH